MSELDSLKLNIYEAYDNGEITYGEKCLLLEKVNLKEVGNNIVDTVSNSKMGKIIDKGTDSFNKGVNNNSRKLANTIIKGNSMKAHKMRNNVMYTAKLLQTAAGAGAVTAAPITQPGNAIVLGSGAKNIIKSKDPLDRLTVKKAKEMKDKIIRAKEINKELSRKADTDKSTLNTALKNYPHLGFIPENTEED